MKRLEDYVSAIVHDEREKFVSEQTVLYTEKRIERLYKFHDNAVVKYEWQSLPENLKGSEELFNHRFTLVEPPSPNPNNFKPGVIEVINYPSS
ncbi:MAG: hypothetical protein D6735_03525 [Acidobacteria bacterium]|nr:MAG: hypothetical protein D6735_03525 [Acidobacteriota bacterium]